MNNGLNPQPQQFPTAAIGKQQDLLSNSESSTARHIGTVIHKALERIGNEDYENWNSDKIKQSQSLWSMQLQQLGVPAIELASHINTMAKAINHVLNDERGQWILSNQHQDAHCEYPLTAVIDDNVVNVIIDRCFIDNTQTRWIIDYKTAAPAGSLETFYKQQQQAYAEQLNLYTQIIQMTENKPVRCAPYFPLFNS